MKFKRLVAVALLLCMVVSLASCKSGATQAKQVVADFMTALTTYDLGAMSKCVEDIPDNTGSVYIHDIYSETEYKDLYTVANKVLSYSVVSANSKEVKLKVTMPDIYSLYQENFMSVLSWALSDEAGMNYVLDEEKDPQLLIVALMIDSIEKNSIKTVEEEITLSVGKINGEYKILTDEQLEILMTSKLCLAQKNVASEVEETPAE